MGMEDGKFNTPKKELDELENPGRRNFLRKSAETVAGAAVTASVLGAGIEKAEAGQSGEEKENDLDALGNMYKANLVIEATEQLDKCTSERPEGMSHDENKKNCTDIHRQAMERIEALAEEGTSKLKEYHDEVFPE